MRAALYACEEPVYVAYWGHGTSEHVRLEFEDQRRRIEDRLRTYMTGGAAPSELEEKAEAFQRKRQEEKAKFEAERVEASLRREYGPRD